MMTMTQVRTTPFDKKDQFHANQVYVIRIIAVIHSFIVLCCQARTRTSQAQHLSLLFQSKLQAPDQARQDRPRTTDSPTLTQGSATALVGTVRRHSSPDPGRAREAHSPVEWENAAHSRSEPVIHYSSLTVCVFALAPSRS